MKEVLLSKITCESRFIEVVNIINSLFSNRIIEYIYKDHFYKPQGIYKYCCSPQRYVDTEWPHMKTFLSMNPEKYDKSIAIVLPLNGIQNVRELLVNYDKDQLIFKYNYNLNPMWEGSFAMTFYDEV